MPVLQLQYSHRLPQVSTESPVRARVNHRTRFQATARNVDGQKAVVSSIGSCSGSINRREALSGVTAFLIALPVSVAAEPVQPPETAEKVVVLGGTGFVGSRICERLAKSGFRVISVSRRGKVPEPTDEEAPVWKSKISWIKADVLKDDLSAIFEDSKTVISCIGVIGGSYENMETGNGAANIAAVKKSKSAGVEKFVYISVASIVPDSVEGLLGSSSLEGYFAGKREAEAAVLEAFPDSAVVVRPSFVYGGSEFGLSPPRVAGAYGSAVEALLSSSPVKNIARIMPGPVALTLEPPVAVENVAAAAVAGAVGAIPPGIVDGTAEINAAAAELPA